MLKQQSLVARHTIHGLMSNARTLVPKYERLTGDVRLVGQVYRTTPRCGLRVRNRGRWRDGEAEVRARLLKMFGGKRSSIGLARLLNAGSERSLAPDIGRAASKMEKGGILPGRRSISNRTSPVRRSSRQSETRAITECRVSPRGDAREVRTGHRAGRRNIDRECCALGEQRQKLLQVPALANHLQYVA